MNTLPKLMNTLPKLFAQRKLKAFRSPQKPTQLSADDGKYVNIVRRLQKVEMGKRQGWAASRREQRDVSYLNPSRPLGLSPHESAILDRTVQIIKTLASCYLDPRSPCRTPS